MPNAHGEPHRAGHLPQLEQPEATFGALDAFIRKNPGRPAA
jgi:hypothetical protein